MRIKIYTTNTCIPCLHLKAWLDERGHEYEMIDVGPKNPQMREEMVRLSGQIMVPTILIDEQVISGFNPKELEEILDAKD